MPALVALAVVLASGASVVLMFSTVTVTRQRVGVSVDPAIGGPDRTITIRERAVDDLSGWTLGLYGSPVLVAAAPLLAIRRRRRRTFLVLCSIAVVLLNLWGLLFAFGGGELYLLAGMLIVAAMAIAATSDFRRTAPRRQ